MGKVNDFIRVLRERSGFTQANVAKELGMARATYAALEDGREPKLSELERVAELYSMSVAELITAKDIVPEEIDFNFDIDEELPREITPVLNPNKLREVLLYLINKIGAKPNVGETVLYKLLYFIDFDYYEKTGRSITGLTYVKLPRGPVPKQQSFLSVITEMKKAGDIQLVEVDYHSRKQKKYLPLRTYDSLSVTELSAKELLHINWEIDRLSDQNATKLSDFSHKDMPWVVAKDNEELEYQFVFYRTIVTAVTEEEDDL